MAAFDQATLDRWRALAIVDRDGTTVGTISEFYLDRETGYPTWALVDTGMFGATQTFVPLVHATEIADGLQVPYEKRHIKDSPRVDLHDELSPDEEADLFAHYGVDYEPSTEPLAGVENEPGAGSAEAPGPVPAEPGSVPEEPGSVAPAEAVEGAGGSAPPDPTEAVPVGHEPGEADGGRYAHDADTVTAGVPDEPGTAEPDETGRVDQDDSRADGVEQDEMGPGVERSEGSPDLDPGSDPDPSRFRSAAGDPDLGRTALVEPGLPGSTAASPYGPPSTIDKGAHPAEPPPDQPMRAPDEAAWAPSAAGSFEEQGPVDPPPGASDRWREAKLAAERDRIARAAAAQPEDRSPLERARRRLERLVGVGQEPADHDDMSPADRGAAEQARRARLGLDEEDRSR
jgi:PRC-barrel domain